MRMQVAPDMSMGMGGPANLDILPRRLVLTVGPGVERLHGGVVPSIDLPEPEVVIKYARLGLPWMNCSLRARSGREWLAALFPSWRLRTVSGALTSAGVKHEVIKSWFFTGWQRESWPRHVR